MGTQTASLAAGGRIRSRGRTITEADLVGFSALTGDWHPQHADAEWARTSRFGERIAHGMLVLSYSIGLVGFDPAEVVALRGIDGLTFKRPVRIGESIRVEADVAEARALDPEHELVTLRWRVLASERLALRAQIQVVRRLPAAAGAEVGASAAGIAQAPEREPASADASGRAPGDADAAGPGPGEAEGPGRAPEEVGGRVAASNAAAGSSAAAAPARELYGSEVLL